MRILVTGVAGFVGGHLAESLVTDGANEVHGVSRRATWPAELAHLSHHVRLHTADMTNGDDIDAILRAVQPEQVYHLAGYAHNGQSFRESDAAWTGNLFITHGLYTAIECWGGSVRVLYVSSGMIYGAVESLDRPCDESTALRPVSPYAASKAAADLLSYQVTHYPGLDVVRVRPFNQFGPRQSPQYAVGHFARQLARIERGLAPPQLETGDLDARRDLTDVRDMVSAYRLIMECGERGDVYNAGSGKAIRIGDVLDILCGMCSIPVDVVARAERMRPGDVGTLVAEACKLRAATGWQPSYGLEQTLHDTLEYWRRTVAIE